MTQDVVSINKEQSEENRKKRKLMDISHVPNSQLPHRAAKASTGVVLGRFETEEELDTFIENCSLDMLQSRPTRRRNC
jgi:hypothetical protein